MASKSPSSRVPTLSLQEIIAPLTEALRRAFKRRDLALNEIEHVSTVRRLYAMTGAGSLTAMTDRRCILNQLFPRTNPELWIGLQLELRAHAIAGLSSKENFEIFHVSIQAFEGSTAQLVEPLLRVEWDPKISRSRNGPAQPHWHAYSKAPSKPQAFLSGDIQDFGSIPEQISSKDRQHKIHFALCANWHKEGGSHFEPFPKITDLNEWIIGAVTYIHSQC